MGEGSELGKCEKVKPGEDLTPRRRLERRMHHCRLGGRCFDCSAGKEGAIFR